MLVIDLETLVTGTSSDLPMSMTLLPCFRCLRISFSRSVRMPMTTIWE